MSKLSTCRCGGLKEDGKCSKCNNLSARRTTKERGYGHDWRKLSERIRSEQPLCVKCDSEGRVTPATQVHHIDTIETTPARRLDRTNLVPLCDACHQSEHESAGVSK